MAKINTIYQPRPNRGKKRVAAYCRVSSSKDEQLHSFSAQVDYYLKTLGCNDDIEFIGIYADEGISGTNAQKRPKFMEMIQHCRDGKIDCLYTKSVSRFGRNTVDTLQYTRELKNLGVDVYFEKEKIHSVGAEGELMLTLMASFAESEVTNMSHNIKWGLRRTYEKGQVESLPLGKFYGYKQDNRIITIIENEAEIIRRIYREYLDGYNSAEIAKGLTCDGIPTERGNEVWHETVIRKILHNEKYKGDSLFQKSFISSPITHKRKKTKAN